MVKILFTLFLSFFFFSATAHQKDSISSPNDSIKEFRRNAIYLELLGNAGIGLYSLNYDRRFHDLPKSYFTYRVGFSVIDDYICPVLVNWILRKDKRNHFEMGAGMTFAFFRRNFGIDNDLMAVTGCFVYRYQKPRGRFVFRIGSTPVWYYNNSRETKRFLMMVGVSFGYAF